MTLIKRSDKGQALTYEEMDGNFTHLGGDGSYRFPSTDGSANQVLQTDGNGNLSFQDAGGLPELITADFKGSVFADDSTLLVDGVNGKIVAPVETTTVIADIISGDLTGNVTGNVTGTHSGNVIADDSTVLVEAYSGTINLNNTSITSLIDVGYASATIGHVLKWDGARWTSQPESGAAVSASNADLLDGFDGTYYLDYTNFTNKPTLATVATSNDYTDLDNTPTLAAVATSGAYGDLSGTPTLAAVATSNDYNDLDNKPTASTPIGEGQTWQDVTASRALNTTYTNTTGRPIMISIYCAGQPNHCEWELLVDGVQLGHQGVISVASAAMRATMSAIVPAGSTYRANNILNAGLQSWAELR